MEKNNPPSYEESERQNKEKQEPEYDSNSQKGYNADYKPQYQQNSGQAPPDNTYFVPPQMVNITSANPQHLNPSYQQYVSNEWRRPAPDPQAPLAPSSKSSGKSSGFPGRNGATYNNAANK